jgi:hypothetical protein
MGGSNIIDLRLFCKLFPDFERVCDRKVVVAQ